jgi:protein SCO1/2
MTTRMSRGWALAGAIALICSFALAACGGSSSSGDPAKKPNYAGGIATPQVVAPPLQLKNSLGQPVNIDDYRGKAVLVTFIYDHCPDICPLIVGHLHTALEKLGADQSKFQIIAVSVDPKGDTPKTVKKFLADHQMTGKMQYLIGSRPTLQKVWKAWHISAASRPTKNNPDAVEHSALVYGIDGSGKITTIYPANFRPQMIVHDVPLLASQ